MRKSNYLWLLLVAVLLTARSGNGCQEEKREGSDRPRTLGRGVVSNGCSGTRAI